MVYAAVAADLTVVGAYGMCVVNTDAFVAGVASIPSPFDDADWAGWFVWRSFSLRIDSVTQVGVVSQFRVQEVDSKAMRKISQNETVVTVATLQAGAFSISSPLRMLLKLS